MDRDKLISIIIRIVGLALLIAVVFAFVYFHYWVATSDLPDWFKFWLLQKR